MKIEIDGETADNITLENLMNSYDIVFEDLRKTLTDEDFIATHSFDFDEEVFTLIKDLKAFELLIEYFGGCIKVPVDLLIKELNEEVYLTEKSMSELKQENEALKHKTNILEEELKTLKEKIKGLF